MKIKSVTYDYEAYQLLVSCASKLDLDKLIAVFQKATVESETQALDLHLRSLIQADRVIDAIKLHREKTGSSLLASKNYIDSLRGL